MAITKSARKAIRSSARKRLYNLRRSYAIRKAVKGIRRLIAEGKISEAEALIPKAYKAIDKAAKTKYLKLNTAAKMKSHLAAFVRNASSHT